MPNSKCHYIIVCTVLLFQGVLLAQERPLATFLTEIEREYNITFNYDVDAVKNATIVAPRSFSSLEEALALLKTHTSFLYRRVSAKIITVFPIKKTTLCGYVRDINTQEPIPEAIISLDEVTTSTESDGYFEIEVTPSSSITLSASGYLGSTYDIEKLDRSTCNKFYLSQRQTLLAPVELSSYLVKGINKLSDGSFQINFSSFSLLPGLVEADVLLTTQALPGIQSTDETVSNINIRGGSNDQNLVLWDDIKMYQTGHFFGLISAFNPNITRQVSVKKNGTEAAYTDGVSGTIAMQTEANIAQHTSGNIGTTLLSADGYIDASLSDRSSLQVALRHSINQIARTPTYDSYFDRISQETEVSENQENITNSNQDFNFYDGSLRWLYNISNKDKLRVNFLIIGNDLSFTETASTETFTESRNSNLSQNSISSGIYYERLWNENSKTQVHVYDTNYKLRAVNANIFNNQRLLQENIISESGIRLKHNVSISQNLRFSGGYHLTETKITNLNDVDNPLFRERISEVVRSHGVFGQGYFKSHLQKTKLSLGVRANYLDKFDIFLVEPRFTFSHRISNQFTAIVLGEFKNQTTSQIINLQNDFLGIEQRRWQLANNQDIPIIKSKQASVGMSYKRKGWLIDATGYYKTVDGITTQSQGFDTKYEFSRSTGSYDVTGLDLLIRKKLGTLQTWLSYGYMNNDYTFVDLPEVRFPSNFDITHTIALGITYDFKKWKISSGINWHTGQPTTTPVAGNELLSGQVNFNDANSNNLSDYMRVDASALYDITTTDKVRLEAGVSVWNIINRDNTIGSFYRVVDESVIFFAENALSTTLQATLRLYF